MINENNKKIPCGGFYLGDGLTMDGNTLKSLGGEQVQSDYTQNDPTAKDYIKNRPFYEYVIRNSVLADICSEVTASGGNWVSNDGVIRTGSEAGVVIYIDSLISIGDSLQVILNGNSYTCPVEDYSSFLANGVIGFGDSSLLVSGTAPTYTASTYGFVVVLMPTSGLDKVDQTKPYIVLMAAVSGSAAPTEFKIIGDANKIVKIDEKYLPDNIATVGMVQNVSEQANSAKTTADNAQSTANTAKTTADNAYPRAGESKLWLRSNNSGTSGNMFFSGKPNEPIYCHVDRCSASNVSAPARFVFVPNGGLSMQVEGINVLQMKSSSGKIFNITVDDSGTISATEVTS